MNTIQEIIELKRKIDSGKISVEDIQVENNFRGFEIFDLDQDDRIIWTNSIGKDIAEFLGVNFEQ